MSPSKGSRPVPASTAGRRATRVDVDEVLWLWGGGGSTICPWLYSMLRGNVAERIGIQGLLAAAVNVRRWLPAPAKRTCGRGSASAATGPSRVSLLVARPSNRTVTRSRLASRTHCVVVAVAWVEVLAVEGALTVARRSAEKSMDGGESATHATGLLFAMALSQPCNHTVTCLSCFDVVQLLTRCCH
jgi:hypothetical protein